MTTSKTPVVILGAGLAGLAAAFRLQSAGARVRLLEASERVGGTVRSVRIDGHLFEHGPTTVPSTAPNLARLIDDCGAREQAIESRPLAGRRLVWRHGRLHSLPEKPPQLLTTSVLGPFAKLRLFLEPFVPARPENDEDETLLEFGRRRLGRGAVDAFLDPFVTGVFAGRLDRLGVDALPRLAEWEREHGSLFRALRTARREAVRSGRARSGPAPLVSFPDGLETLPRILAETLGPAVDTGCRATSIERRGDGFRVHFADARGAGDARGFVDAEAVVIATSADVAQSLAAPLLPAEVPIEAFAEVFELAHPFVATVGLGLRRRDVEHPLDAFGLLVASDSRPPEADVLGVLFASSIFEGRAPDEAVTLTVMIGGERDPDAATLDDSALVERARTAVETFLGARGEPTAVTVARWPRAIPQYPPGHRRRVAALRRALDDVPGLALAGNYLDGVGVEGVITSAEAAVASILPRLRDEARTRREPS